MQNQLQRFKMNQFLPPHTTRELASIFAVPNEAIINKGSYGYCSCMAGCTLCSYVRNQSKTSATAIIEVINLVCGCPLFGWHNEHCKIQLREQILAIYSQWMKNIIEHNQYKKCGYKDCGQLHCPNSYCMDAHHRY